MIYDSLNHISAYAGTHPGVYRGLKLLAETDFSQMEDGRYEVDGDQLFYSLQSYQSKPINDAPEAHREYIDIQCVLSGAEEMTVSPLEEMTEEVLPRPEGDIRLYHGPVRSRVELVPGMFAVLFPGDAHAPGIAVGGTPAPCRKAVVKVKVEYQ